MRTKHISRYSNWLVENSGEKDTLAQIDDLNSQLTSAKSAGQLDTRTVMDWFHSLLKIYDSVEYKGLIFMEMKKVIQRYYSDLYPIFRKNNPDLTKRDIQEILRYKEIAGQETKLLASAEATLKELGLL